MAPSQVSGMKMRNFLFLVIFGLLAVVHSTPINTMTQIPTKAEDDVFRDALTEGFLVNHFLLPSLTAESPERNTTVQASQQSSSDSQWSDVNEGSAEGETNVKSTATSMFLKRGGEDYAPTTQRVSRAQSSTSTALASDTEDTGSPSSDLGSDGEMIGQSSSMSSSMTSSANAEPSTASSTSTSAPQMFAGSDGSGSGSGSGISEELSTFAGGEEPGAGLKSISEKILNRAIETNSRSMMHPLTNGLKEKEPENPLSAQNKGYSTPGWIIILGFIVGLAALVMICVAIATRDKWNGPDQASQLETKTNSSNQQRELELETFLHKDSPRENGKAEEYTAIPLDELPEKYLSH